MIIQPRRAALEADPTDRSADSKIRDLGSVDAAPPARVGSKFEWPLTVVTRERDES